MTHHASRITHHASRITHHASRITQYLSHDEGVALSHNPKEGVVVVVVHGVTVQDLWVVVVEVVV
jgi:hypothetical protein